MKKLLLFACILSLALFSCGEPRDDIVTDRQGFWAHNMVTGRDYQLDAELLAEGKYCNVWAEAGSGVAKAAAKSMATAYDNDIHNQIINVFSMKDILYGDEEFDNVIDFASYWTDNDDGKLCILLLDIKDGATKATDPFVAGYFSPSDFWENGVGNPGSNYRPMIYIDTSPGIPGSKLSNTTLAHELQHLINYATTLLIRFDDGDFPMDTWIDEGLSAAAEWIYSREHDLDKISFYTANHSKLIDLGNNFFVWNNHQDNDYAIMDDYATVYLFFQWLRLQAGNNDIYYDIITASDEDGFGYFDKTAVVIGAYDNIDECYDDWELLLLDWFAANYINNSSSRYGYKNDSVLKNIKAHTAPNGKTEIDLYPGEGVYSIIPGNFGMPDPAGSITYVSVNPAPDADDVFDFFESIENWVLLTYNASDYNNLFAQAAAKPEKGKTTGVAANVSVVSRRTVAVPGPIRLDARDMLRRNGVGGGNFSRTDTRRSIRGRGK